MRIQKALILMVFTAGVVAGIYFENYLAEAISPAVAASGQD